MADPFYITLASSLAIHFCENLLDATTRRVREKFSGDTRKQALTSALREGLETALAAFHLEDVEQDHFSTLFETFLGEQDVVDEFTHLIDPRPNTSLNLELLRSKFNALGFDDKTLAIFSFDVFIHQFGEAFYSAAAQQTDLQGAIEIGLLRETVDHLGDISTYTERTANAAEQTAEATDKISVLMDEFLKGHNTKLSAVIEQTKGFEQLFVLLERIIALLSKSGYDISINDVNNGNVIIGNSNQVEGVTRNSLLELQSEINRLRQDVITHEPSEEDLQVIEKRYRQHLITWFERLTFHGMMRTAKAISLPLEEVYVELRAVGEVPEAADTFSVEERRLMLEVEDKDESAKQELLRHMDTLRRERWSRTNVERKSISETLFKQDQLAFVILGDPGSGKSTLLHLLALVYARGQETIQKRLKAPTRELNRLPIFVPLAAFDDMLRSQPGLTLLEFLPKYFDRRRLIPGLAPLFQRALENGNALVLFDGLDEVLDATTRRYVANQVTTMMNEYTPRGVRFVMTSRFVGYREAPIGGDIPHLSVLDFGREEIKTFVHQWSHTYEKWVQGGKESLESTRAAHQLEKDLLEDVESNSSVRRLAANPLMLTMLALLRRQVGKLPHRRIELYKRYMDTMIDNWVEARTSGEREQAIKISDPHVAESLLIPLAYWLQSSQPSGTASKAMIQTAVTDICLRDEGFDPASAPRQQRKNAEEHARKFLDEMRNMSGLIVERGNDAFGFLHLTFQEYFAGRALAKMKTEERWREVSPHLHDPRWQESILLCAGQLGIVEKRRADVSDFVRNIQAYEDLTEKDLHRNLLVSLTIAGDDVNLEPQLIEYLVNQAIDCLPTKTYIFASEIFNRISQLAANGITQAENFFSYVWGSQDNNLITLAIKSTTGCLENKKIKMDILKLLNHHSYDIRNEAIRTLESVIQTDDKTRAEFIKQLDRSESEYLVIDGLGRCLQFDKTVKDEFIKRIDSAIENNKLEEAARYISTFELDLVHDNNIKTKFINFLNHDSAEIRNATISVLAPLAQTDMDIKDLLRKKLADKSFHVRFSALLALYKNQESSSEFSEIVLNTFADNEFFLYATISGFNIDLSRAEFKEILINFLSNPLDEIKISAINILAPLILTDNRIKQKIISLIDDKEIQVRSEAITALATFASADTQIKKVIESQLSQKSWQVRESAIDSVGQSLSNPTNIVEGIRLLLEAMDNIATEESANQIQDIIQELSITIERNPDSRDAIISYINHEDLNVRKVALTSIPSTLIQVPEIKQAVLSSLNNLSVDAELTVIKSLAQYFLNDKQIEFVLLNYLDSSDPLIKAHTLRSLSPQIKQSPVLQNKAFEILVSDDNWLVKSIAIYALSPLIATSKTIFQQIELLLQSENLFLRLFAAYAFIPQIPYHTYLRDKLLSVIKLAKFDLYETEDILFMATSGSNYINLIFDDLEETMYFNQGLFDELAKLLYKEDGIEKLFFEYIDDPLFEGGIDAAISLAAYAKDNEGIRKKLLERLQKNNIEVRIIYALEDAIEDDAKVRHEIMNKLDSSSKDTRNAAIRVLGKYSPTDEQVLHRLIKCLQDESENVRSTALSELSNAITTNANVKQSTIACLHDPNKNVRQIAINILSDLDYKDIPTREKIIEHIDDSEWFIRNMVVGYIKSLLINKEIFIDEMNKRLVEDLVLYIFSEIEGLDDKSMEEIRENKRVLRAHLSKLIPSRTVAENLESDSWIRRKESLLLLFNQQKISIADMFQSSLDYRGLESYPARLTAASYLLNRDPYSIKAIQICLDALEFGIGKWDNLPQYQSIREQAARILGTLEPVRYDQRVYDQLYKSMTTDENAEVRNTAYTALVKLARAREFTN